MRNRVAGVVVAVAAMVVTGARGGEVNFSIRGGGMSASGTLTFGADAKAGDPAGALAITGIVGTFSDSNLGIVDQAITGLVAIDPPSSHGDPLIPPSMTVLLVTNPPPRSTGLSYDNLLYLSGSPQTCTDYPASGGYLDVYGLMFTVAGGYVVDVWSNGVFPGAPASSLDYGAAVALQDPAGSATYELKDYQEKGVRFAIPEPASLGMFGVGLGVALGLARSRRRAGLATG